MTSAAKSRRAGIDQGALLRTIAAPDTAQVVGRPTSPCATDRIHRSVRTRDIRRDRGNRPGSGDQWNTCSRDVRRNGPAPWRHQSVPLVHHARRG